MSAAVSRARRDWRLFWITLPVGLVGLAGVIGGVATSEIEIAVVGFAALTFFFWTQGFVESIRRRTTALFSPAQVLALFFLSTLAEIAIRWLWAPDSATLIEIGAAVFFLVWFAWALMNDGWSKRPPD